MTTSHPTPFLSEIVEGSPIPPSKLGYFRARLSNRIHELVLDAFMKLEAMGKISRADLARRIGRKPEQVTRWLGAPGNWTIETVSDLLLGMGCELGLSVVPFAQEQVLANVPYATMAVGSGISAANAMTYGLIQPQMADYVLWGHGSLGSGNLITNAAVPNAYFLGSGTPLPARAALGTYGAQMASENAQPQMEERHDMQNVIPLRQRDLGYRPQPRVPFQVVPLEQVAQ
jgi:hypothetical protein